MNEFFIDLQYHIPFFLFNISCELMISIFAVWNQNICFWHFKIIEWTDIAGITNINLLYSFLLKKILDIKFFCDRCMKVFGPQSTVYSLQSTVYSLQSTVYTLQSTVYSLQSIFYGIHSTAIIYGLNSVVYNLYSSICWYLPSLWVFTDFMSGHDSIILCIYCCTSL